MIEAMNRITAIETLRQMEIVSYPHFSKKDQTKVHKAIHARAYPEAHKKETYITFEQMGSLLSKRGS